MPDELARGYLARASLFNRLNTPEAICALVASAVEVSSDAAMERPFVEVLAKLTEMTPGAFYTEHTLAPFQRAVRPAHECVAHGCDQDVPERMAHVRAFGRSSVQIQLCPQCVKEDIPYWGFSYWRKSHQFRGVVFCSKHEVGLHVANDTKWTSLPEHVIHQSTPFDEKVVADALRNPVIRRYEEICATLASNAYPASTKTLIHVIRQRMERVCPNERREPLRITPLVLSKVDGPWLQHFFPQLYRPNMVSRMNSLDRTVISEDVAYATPYYALALASLFESTDEAVSLIAHSSLDGVDVTEQVKKSNCQPDIGGVVVDHSVAAAVQDLISGASIVDAAQAQGLQPATLEALLLAVAQPHLKQLLASVH